MFSLAAAGTIDRARRHETGNKETPAVKRLPIRQLEKLIEN
jgi:hypothetical protein